jgi:hypothetical protein
VARETAISNDASQMFLFKSIAKWMPGAGPPPAVSAAPALETHR